MKILQVLQTFFTNETVRRRGATSLRYRFVIRSHPRKSAVKLLPLFPNQRNQR